jgi:hypothetical protein
MQPLTANVEQPNSATIFCGFFQYNTLYLWLKYNVFMFPFSPTLNVIKNVSASPYIVLLHITVDAVSCFQNFLCHFLYNAYFENYYTQTHIEP